MKLNYKKNFWGDILEVFFHTLGCKVNQYESEAMQKIFTEKNYRLTNNFETADIIVVNTCTVTALSSQKSRQLLRKFSRENNKAVIIAVGCYAQNNPQEISNIDGVDIIIGNQDKIKIVELVENFIKDREKIFHVDSVENISEFEELPHTPQKTRAFLKIEDGCNNFCSYCIIPYVRGKVRSRSLENIRAECLNLKNNFKEIVLTGIHIGAYGKDFSEKINLTDAIKIVLDSAEPARLRLGSIESVELTDEIISLLKNDNRICNHLHIPLQSGSNEILKSMRRPYTTENFSALMKKISAEIPEISIGTDLIVGFPGETEENFMETVNFLENNNFSKIHVFPFSARAGTLAAGMENQIDSQTKKIRVNKILEIAKSKEKIFAEKFLTRTVEIIAETEENNFVDGLTKNYLRVYVPANEKIQLGEIIKVRIEKIFKNGLLGELA